MIAVLHSSWALMLGILLIMLGNGLQGTLLGVRGSMESIDPYWMGFIMSAYFAGFLGGSKVAPILLKRVGHVRVFAALGSLVSAVFILYAAIVDPIFWIVMRLLVGFCFAGIYVVAESWINDTSTNENRGQALSLYVIVQMAGIVMGQLMLNLADPGGYALFVLISVMVSLAFTPILLSVSPAPMFQTARAMSLKELFKVSPLGCISIFMLGGVFSALFGMAAVYATERGLSILEISYFTAIIYVGGLLMQYPIGWFSDRMDRRILILLVSIVCALTSAVAMWIESGLTELMIIAFLIGGTANPLYALIVAYTNDYLESDQRAAASGGLIFINGIGAMGGPVLVGFLMEHIGPSGFFLFIGTLMGLIALYSMYRMTQREAIAIDDSSPHTYMSSRTSPVAAEIAVEIAIEEEEAEAEAEAEATETKTEVEKTTQ